MQNTEINDKILKILAQNKLEQLQGKSIKYASFNEMMSDLSKNKRQAGRLAKKGRTLDPNFFEPLDDKELTLW